jgi:hypothetical protein
MSTDGSPARAAGPGDAKRARSAGRSVEGVKPIRSLCLCLSLVALPCGYRAATPTDTAQDSVRLDYPEFAFSLPDGGNAQWVRTICDSLLANYQRITRHLHVSTMPRMRVSIWAHDAGFYDAMRRDLGQVYAGAAGYLAGPTELRLLYRAATPHYAVHEFAHAVSLALNPRFGNRPRWLWEAVAVYETRDVTDASGWANEAKRFPGCAALNQYNSPLPYRWGYPIASFIVSQWGDSAYVSLIRSNGDIGATLGVTEAQFGTMIERFIGRQ